MSEIKFKISEVNLKSLSKYVTEAGDEITDDNLNNHLEDLIEVAFSDISFTEAQKKDQEEDDVLFAELEVVAKEMGIKIPPKRLFRDSDSLEAYLMMKFFVNDLAIEKLCGKYIEIFDDLPLED